ncbi:hypothetical protein [Actinoplanes utahensis]|uniref:hypothetical protein n=1 Tax=Actinoplanes utahensis TaxID=1869 RepID=UPI0009FD7389|nr:hypothetical protein [Actinoplanes utahensis]GIF35116.1 hypothetical protein Aut01nite_81020 [Actinoplanes utahensis]
MATIAPPYRPFSPGFPPIDNVRRNGGSSIAVTLRYAPLAFLLRLYTPVLEIDGQGVPASWGRVVQSVATGEHHVHVHVPYLIPSRIGAADTTVVAVPGQTVELEYRAPLLSFLRGAIGAPPQRYPGAVAAWTLLALTVALAVCGCLGFVLNSAN